MRNCCADHVEGQLYKWRQFCQLIFMLITVAVISVRDIGNWFETQVSNGTQKLPEITQHCQCHWTIFSFLGKDFFGKVYAQLFSQWGQLYKWIHLWQLINILVYWWQHLQYKSMVLNTTSKLVNLYTKSLKVFYMELCFRI